MIVYVPHFSIVAMVNDSTAPTVTVNTPAGNQTVGMFTPNITVSIDTVNCTYQLNGTQTTVSMDIVSSGPSGYTCKGQTERFRNLNAVVGYNITFFATDAAGNLQTSVFHFNVSDSTKTNTPRVTQGDPSTTTVALTINGVNESVNVTVYSSTSISSLNSGPTATHQTDFNQSQTITLSDLTASTTYHYNVSVCDYNGNCIQNGTTFNFTTDAAAATTSSTSSGSSGSGVSTEGSVKTLASITRVWDAITAGTSTILSISKADISISSIEFTSNVDLSQAELKVSSLSTNPLSSEPTDTVYQFLSITPKNIPSSSIDGTTITFEVPSSWVSEQGVNKEDIVLYRYSGGKWNALGTSYVRSSGSNYEYQSVTPGFSYFAIGSTKAAPPADIEATEEEDTTAVPTEQPPATTTTEQPDKPVQATKTPFYKNTVFIVVALAVLVALVVFVVMRQKKNA